MLGPWTNQHPRPCGGVARQLRGEIEGLLDQAEHGRRTHRVCRRSCRGATSCGRSWTVRARSWNGVRRHVRTYERKVAARERRMGSRKGRLEINLTDADSALMRSRHHEYLRRTTRRLAVSWCWGRETATSWSWKRYRRRWARRIGYWRRRGVATGSGVEVLVATRPTAPARLPTGAAGAAGEGAAGGLDQVDAGEDGTAGAPGVVCASRRWSRCSGS